MSVNWNWKDKIGTIKRGDTELSIYAGSNCLAVLLYEWEDKYQFYNFFNDKTHLRNCLGLSKGYTENLFKEDWDKITFTSLVREAITMGTELIKAGYNVEFKIEQETYN